MRQKVNINTWKRRPQFNFFKNFDEPFWGTTVEIDCTIAYQKTKERGDSFYLYYLHQSMRAANAVENFRYRMEGADVYLYDSIGASATVLRENETFGFSYVDFHEQFSDFVASANKEFARVRAMDDLVPGSASSNVIHYSSLPWFSFTGISHARHFQRQDSAPKISFGKIKVLQGRRLMPVAIHVHHALVDGLHVGRHVEIFQDLMNE